MPRKGPSALAFEACLRACKALWRVPRGLGRDAERTYRQLAFAVLRTLLPPEREALLSDACLPVDITAVGDVGRGGRRLAAPWRRLGGALAEGGGGGGLPREGCG